MKNLIFISYLLLVLSSCGPSPIHSEKLELDGVWEYDENLTSTISVTDTLSNYDLALKMNHSSEFYFQNIYVRIETIFPDGKKISEPLSLQLAKSKGQWNGKCGGESCEILFSLQDNFKFKNLGDHRFSIGQFSRDEKLKGINEIELMLFETASKI